MGISLSDCKAVFIVRISQSADCVTFGAGEIFDNILRGCIFLALFQIGNLGDTVDVSDKTQPSRASHAVSKFAVVIDINIEIAADAVAVFIQNMKDFFEDTVNCGIFFAGFIDILDRDRAGKLVVGERNAVYVVNIASRACNRTLFFDFQFKFLLLVLALYDLQRKNALEQKDCHQNKHDVQKKRSGTDKIDQKSLNFFQQLFCTPSIRTPEPFVQQQKQRIKNKCNNDGVNCFR